MQDKSKKIKNATIGCVFQSVILFFLPFLHKKEDQDHQKDHHPCRQDEIEKDAADTECENGKDAVSEKAVVDIIRKEKQTAK